LWDKCGLDDPNVQHTPDGNRHLTALDALLADAHQRRAGG